MYPLNPKKSLIRILGWQQRQSEVSAESVPLGQVCQALGGDSAAEVEVETKQANAAHGWGADAYRQDGPAGLSVLHRGGAVG